ncbi:MAG: hypothetical protein QOK37_3328 [Thermoanaerobaculia bacterium]|jgi:hypothetical protein|nr:hypothetical protein [Thermoanaerobaculia bacterium]
MSRRRDQRVAYQLDASGVANLSGIEIASILRGADSMIGRGGRTQLSKLLKGSRDAALLEHGLERNPAYGFYKNLTLDEILKRIDWAIMNEYMRVVYNFRLPVLVFTEKGWAIEKSALVEEMLQAFDARIAAGPPYDLSDLKDLNRELIFLFLDRIEASGRRDFVPLLQAWAAIDYKKIRARIAAVIRTIQSGRSSHPARAEKHDGRTGEADDAADDVGGARDSSLDDGEP